MRQGNEIMSIIAVVFAIELTLFPQVDGTGVILPGTALFEPDELWQCEIERDRLNAYIEQSPHRTKFKESGQRFHCIELYEPRGSRRITRKGAGHDRQYGSIP